MNTNSLSFTPIKIGPLTLRNRFIKAATNEGMCKNGIISKGLSKFHEEVAKGGAAMTTVAYCATSKDGQTFIDQAHLSKNTIKDFQSLTDMGQQLKRRSHMRVHLHFFQNNSLL